MREVRGIVFAYTLVLLASGQLLADTASLTAEVSNDFGTVTIGNVQTRVFRITNTDDTTAGTLGITSATVSGAIFTKITDGCSGHTGVTTTSSFCQITVQYVPTAATLQTATLTVVVTGATDGLQKVIALTGTGATATTPTATLTANVAGDHGTVTIGSSSTKTYTLTHGGSGAALTVTSVTTAAPFTKTSDTCTGVSLTSGTCTFDITVTVPLTTSGDKFNLV